MKKFSYSFNQTGTLSIWLTCCREYPELVAQIEPAFAQTTVKHTKGAGEVILNNGQLRTGELPGIIECLLFYQQSYNQN